VTTTRTPKHRGTKSRITAEAVALYRRISAAEGKPKQWDECRADRVALHTMIGRRIWEFSIWGIDYEAETPPAWVKGDIRERDWTTARDLRRALQTEAEGPTIK
jgi:hypothetical protein